MKHPQRRLGLRVLLATLITAAASGCFAAGGTDTAAEPDGDRAVLDVALPWPPAQDYQPYADDGVILARLGVTEGLTTLAADGTAQPALAIRWRQVDARGWELDLRPGVQFQDGTAMTAASVVASLRAALSASPVPSAVDGLGLEPSVVDRDTVRITTGTADPTLPQRLSSPNLPVLAADAFDGRVVDPRGHATGPFELVDTDGVTGATLRAYDGHWAGRPGLAGVSVRYLPDAASRAAAFEAGEVEVSHTVATADAVAQSEHLLEVPLPRDVLVYVNPNRPGTDTPAERATIASAVDQELLAGTVFEGRADAASAIFGPATPWAQRRPAVPTSPEPARPDAPVTVATYSERAELPQVADAVAAELRAQGVTVKQVVRPYTALEPDLLAGRFEVVVGSRSYAVDTGEPFDYLLSDFGCRGSYNLARLCDVDVQRELAAMAAQTSREGRRTAVLAAEHAVLATGAVVPVVHERARYLVADGVTGIAEDPYERRFITVATRVG